MLAHLGALGRHVGPLGRHLVPLARHLLANMSEEELGEDPWLALIHLFNEREPLGALLEIARRNLVRKASGSRSKHVAA